MTQAGFGWTAEDLAATAGRLDPIDERLLVLVACLPVAPLAVLTPFLWCSPGTAHRRLTRLCDAGLLWSLTTPLRAQGRPARLLLPTDFGLAILARRVPREWPTLADCLGRPDPRRGGRRSTSHAAWRRTTCWPCSRPPVRDRPGSMPGSNPGAERSRGPPAWSVGARGPSDCQRARR